MEPGKEVSSRTRIPWRIYLVVAGVAVLLFAGTAYAIWSVRHISVQYTPLLEAAERGSSHTTNAHLWLEEVIDGDPHESGQDVWELFDRAQHYVECMLNGGESEIGYIRPLQESSLRSRAQRIKESLEELEQLARQREQQGSIMGSGTEADQRFDELFNGLISGLTTVEARLRERVGTKKQRIQQTGIFLLAGILFAGIVCGVVLVRYENERRRRYREMLNARQYLACTLDSIGDAVIATDASGNVTRMNPVAEGLTEWSFSEAQNRPLEEVFRIVNADTRETADDPIQRVLESGKTVGLANHTMLIGRDGSEHQIADSGAPIRGPNGEIIGVVLVFRDVTEQYRQQQQLEERERKFRQLIEQSPDAITLHDMDGNIVDVNETALNMYGYSREEMLAMSIPDLDPDYTSREDGGRFWEEMDTGEPFFFQARHKTKNGNILPAEVIVSKINLEDHVYVMAISRDISERRRYEEAIQEREEHLRTTLYSIGDAVVTTDLSGNVVRMNPVAEELTGWAAADAESQPLNRVFNIINARTRESVDNPVKRVLDTGQVQGLANHTMLVAADGNEYQIADSGAPIRGANGEITGVVLVFRDVTEDYNMREALRQSEEKFRDIFHHASDAIVVMDLEGHFVEVNDVACRTLGYTREELLDLTPKDIEPKAEPAVMQERIRAIKEDGYIVFESEHTRKDGSVFPVEVKGREIEYDGRPCVIGVARDLTERKEAEEALRESEERFRTVLENLAAGVFAHDLDGHIVFVNDAACRSTGYTREELLSMYVSDIDPNAVSRQDAERIWHKMEVGQSTRIRSSHTRKDGSQFPVDIHITAVTLSGRRIILALAFDITEDLRREEELRKARQHQIEHERHRALAEMASGIAHDFNNALSPIQSYAELLLENPEKLDERERALRYLRHIQRSASTATETVRRMRKFYQPREEENFLPVDLDYVVREVVSITQPRWKEEAKAAGKDVKLSTELNAAGEVVGNEAELHEMLTNLIFNAVDAIPDQGTISIRTYPAEDAHVVLEVSDDGMGMSEETRQKCLDPFYTTKGPQGSGLGLSTLQGVVQRHGGELRVESVEGEGTTFRIRLPLREQVEEEGDVGTSQADNVGSLKILAVEDEPSQREVLEEILALEGHRVHLAADGKEGFEKIREDSYDLMITDRAMPGMNGDQLAAKVKEQKPDQPVVMLTGFGDMMEAGNDYPRNADYLMKKPFSRDSLRKAIRLMLG